MRGRWDTMLTLTSACAPRRPGDLSEARTASSNVACRCLYHITLSSWFFWCWILSDPEPGRSLFPTNRGWLWVPDGDSCVTASCESCCSCGSWKRVSLSNYVATQSSSLLRSSLFLLHKPVANHHYTLAKPPKLPTGSLWILANTWLCLAASVFSPGLLLWPIININCIDCRGLSLSLWPGCAG